MSFQEIAIRCGDSSLAINHLSTFFQFCNVRPILITDVGNHDISVIKGLACIPWTLVADFDFGGDISPNTLRDVAESEAAYVFKINDLPLNNVNPADMSDVGPVYWVKALGPSNQLIFDPQICRLQLLPSLCKYIIQACSAMASKVKIIIVWSGMPVSSDFGQAISDLCLTAQQFKSYDKTEITVVCPTVDSSFMSKFNHLPYQPEILSMELTKLSDFQLEQNQTGCTIDDWRSIPGKHYKLSVETVKSIKAGELDYLYPKIEDRLDMNSYDNGLAFFQGSVRFVRWEDFKTKKCF